MKKLSTLSVAFPALLLLAGCFSKSDSTQGRPDMSDKLNSPNEYFNLQRSYPDPYLDWKAFQKGIIEARDAAVSRGTGFDGEWTVQGPGNIGARANTVAVHPINENIIYTGFSCGGVWKTTNGGTTWQSIFDEQLWPAIGDIVIDPNNPETVYVGTGDANISSYTYLGDGLYKSTDGGTTWQHLGLENQRIISKIVLHPTDPNIIFVGSMGLPFIRDNDRGLYRSTDGGTTWEQVLFISNQAGVIDVIMDPFNPNILYASGWDRVRNNTESLVTGPGAKVFRSTDGGDTWTELGNGLPTGEMGRTGLAYSYLTPGLIYAMFMDTDSQLGGIYKTTDGGDNWEPMMINGLENAMGGFGWYFGKMRTSPFNDDELFVLGIELWQGLPDLGVWFEANPPWWTYEVHADKHDLTFSASGKMYLATDGGLYKSSDNGSTWVDIENIPTTQFYRVAFNPHQPDWYYGGAQDNGTTGGNASMINDWPRIYGGDGFQMTFHPTEPDIFFVETQNGGIAMTDNGGFDFFTGDDGIDQLDRRNWDMPYIISPHNPNVMYAGTFKMYKSDGTAGIPFYNPISNDLTDGLILHPRHHNITSISESPQMQGLLYVGTADGNVWVSSNDGTTWNNISNSLPDRYVTCVKASPSADDRIFVTHSGYRDNEFIPRLHRSDNRGGTWQDISADLPNVAINDVFILPDHADSVLFVATDAGVYASLNSGGEWERLGTNMPFVPSFDLEWNPVHNTLIAGTFARSIMTYPLDSLLYLEPDTTTATHSVADLHYEVKISPNPASQHVQIACTGFPGKTSELVLLDASGRVLHTEFFQKEQDINRRMNVADLPKGSYVVKVKSGQAVRTGRFVKL